MTRHQARKIRERNSLVRKEHFRKKKKVTSEAWKSLLTSNRLAESAPRCPEEALASWFKDVHYTHGRLYERGGFVVCVRCGGFASRKPHALRGQCSGTIRYRAAVVNIVQKALPPPGYSRWPCRMASEIELNARRPPRLRLIMRSSVVTQPTGECTADLARALSYMGSRQRSENKEVENAAENEGKRRKLHRIRIRGKQKFEKQDRTC